MILRAFVVVLTLLVGSWLFFQGVVPMVGMEEEPDRHAIAPYVEPTTVAGLDLGWGTIETVGAWTIEKCTAALCAADPERTSREARVVCPRPTPEPLPDTLINIHAIEARADADVACFRLNGPRYCVHRHDRARLIACAEGDTSGECAGP